MKQTSIWSRIKRLLFPDVIIRKITPTPERDKLIHGESLRQRFNRVRHGCRPCPYFDPNGSLEGYNMKYWSQDGSGLKSREEFLSGSDDGYKHRFNLANMVEDIWVPVRPNEEK